MRDSDWEKVKYFSIHDNFGDPYLMSPKLIFELDALRAYIKKPIHVLCGSQGIHKGDTHKNGLAVDIVCPSFAKSLFNFFIAASRFNFSGIGIYPHWVYNNVRCGGLHLDVRDMSIYTEKISRAYWIGVKTTSGTQYIAFDETNLKHFILT